MNTKLNLSLASRVTLIGLAYIYLIKIIDTSWHDFFTQPALAFSVVGLNILPSNMRIDHGGLQIRVPPIIFEWYECHIHFLRDGRQSCGASNVLKHVFLCRTA